MSIVWDPGAWRFQPSETVSGLVFRAERTSFDMRTSFEEQFHHFGLSRYPGGDLGLRRVQHLDDSLGRLRERTGWVDHAEMRALVRITVERAEALQHTFWDNPYLEDLVPEEWHALTGYIQDLADFYGIPVRT